MFDEIVKMVKDQLGNNKELSNAIPADQKDAVHEEIANHVTNGLKTEAVAQGGAGGLLAKLQESLASGGPVVGAIEGGLVGTLLSKFGLPATVTGAVAGALPGLLKNFLNKANDPNDTSITKESIDKSLSGSFATASSTASTLAGSVAPAP